MKNKFEQSDITLRVFVDGTCCNKVTNTQNHKQKQKTIWGHLPTSSQTGSGGA